MILLRGTLQFVAIAVFTALVAGCQTTPPPSGQSRDTAKSRRIESDSKAALRDLYADTPSARVLGKKASAVLVFPDIVKGGFVFGGQSGNGTLFRGGRTTGYFNSSAASWGLQAGLQKFGYALFFMNDEALYHLDNSRGWELGSTPNLTVVDTGVAGSISTTTLHEGVYAFFFNQRGLMAGISIEGSKITRIYP